MNDTLKTKVTYSILIIIAFFLGMLANSAYTEMSAPKLYEGGYEFTDTVIESVKQTVTGKATEKPSPTDWLSEDSIHVTSNVFRVDAPQGTKFSWAKFTNTNSMDPLIDENTNAIQILPQCEEIKWET